MSVDALNPNHPVTQAIESQWHKIAALILLKLGVRSLTITGDEIEALCASVDGVNIVCDMRGNRMLLRVVNDAEARVLARSEGGLPH